MTLDDLALSFKTRARHGVSLGWPVGWPLCIWGWTRIPDDIVHDWESGAIWHQLRDATLWIQRFCNLAIPCNKFHWGEAGKREGAEFSQSGEAWPPGYPLEPPLCVNIIILMRRKCVCSCCQ